MSSGVGPSGARPRLRPRSVSAFLLFVGLIIFAGRVAIATQAVDSAATQAARTASIARTATDAGATARSAATSSLTSQQVNCVSTAVTVDTAGFAAPRGPWPPSPRPCAAWSTLPTWPCPACPVPAPSPRPRLHRSTRSGNANDPTATNEPTGGAGSISIWLVTTGFAMIVLVGLAVDLGGQVHAQHVRAVADQAARAGGQQLDAAVAVRGRRGRDRHPPARQAATAYLTASGLTGTVTVTGGTTVSPSTSATPTPPRSWGSSASPR